MAVDLDILQKTPLFSGIARDELGGMLACLGAWTVSVSKGQCLYLESDEIGAVGIVLSGAVDLRKTDIRGDTTILQRIAQGEMFGETFACCPERTSTVTFWAAQNSRILYLRLERVLHSCSNACAFHQKLVENMVIQLARKNRSLMEKLEISSKKTLREKILTYLSMEAQRQGTRYFEIPMGRLEMADYLCTHRSALSRELEQMRREGLIDFERNVFTFPMGTGAP